MFTKQSFIVALISAGAYAQGDDQMEVIDYSPSTKDYPLFAAAIAEENPKLTWEAHEVTTSTGYVKTLFHITGMQGWDDYYPHHQPLLIANGAGTNTMSYLFEEGTPTVMLGVTLDALEASWIAEFQAGTVPKTVLEMIKKDYPKVLKSLKPKLVDPVSGAPIDLSTLVDSDEFLADEECQTGKYSDMANMYQVLMANGTYNDLSDSIPQRFFDEGYDIWIEGNRGTVYQDGHANPDISAKDYWDFSFYNMGAEDLMAEVEYILGATKNESLSLIAYSMSTAQLLYSVGTQDDDINVKRALSKIDNALLLTPCPFTVNYSTLGMSFNDGRKFIANYIEEYEDSGLLYVWGPPGEGYDFEKYKEIECEYNPDFCPFLDMFREFTNTVSLKSLMQYTQNSQEGRMLTSYFNNYGKKKFPEDKHFIDFTRIRAGPAIWGFGFADDMTCSMGAAVSVAEELLTFQKLDLDQYCYSYNEFPGFTDPHMVPLQRGWNQMRMVDSMITTLKENTAPLKEAPPAYVDDSLKKNVRGMGALSGI